MAPGGALSRRRGRSERDRGAERGRRYGHTDFRQSTDIDHLSDVYLLTQGEGAQVVTANAVGGGSNLYLAASLRSPTETFERRDRRPDDGPARRMWPQAISRKLLDPYYARAELGLRVRRPTWDQVSKSGGLWAATLAAAGHTCDRVPLAISPERCVNAKWCHTGCIFGAKNSLITNYLWAAENAGARVHPNLQVEQITQSSARPYRYVVQADVMDNEGPSPTRAPTGQQVQIECKVLVLAAGAMSTAPLLMRSRPALPAMSEQVGCNLGSNGDHVAAVEFDPAKVRPVLGLPGYDEFYKGKPITTMSYDWWAGRRAHAYDGTRFTLQEIFLSTLTNFLYDGGRTIPGGPSWWGLQKKRAVAHWANRIECWRWSRTRTTARSSASARRGCGAAQRRADRGGDLQLCAVRPIGGDPDSGKRGDPQGRDQPPPRAVHAADRDAGRLLRAPARRLPDGRVAGPGRRRRRRRRVRLRGPVLHRRVDRADLARSQSVADDLRPVRTLRRAARRPRSRLRSSGQAGGLPACGAARARRPQGGADGELAPAHWPAST